MEDKNNIYGLTRRQLAEWFSTAGQPAFRADQVYDWLYVKGEDNPANMTNLPKDLRPALEQAFTFSLPAIDQRLVASDQTVKYRIALSDDRMVECVMMPDLDDADAVTGAVSMCISSQVGCALKCDFCATGTMGWTRDLTTAEIVGQVVLMLRELPFEPRSRNILFMGMGEPLLNVDAVVQALEIFNDELGLAFPMRRITVSTAGIPKAMYRLFDLERPPRLALSLHAPDQELRLRIMPISRRYTLEELMQVCKELPLSSREKITMEYILLRGLNDSTTHAAALADLLEGMQAKVNLIPHNAVAGIDHQEPEETAITSFMKVLSQRGLTVTVRRSRGRDAAAACGQLALEKQGSGV